MSYLSVRGEQSTSSEITALTNLAALAASGTGEFIRKTSATEFENAELTLENGGTGSSLSDPDADRILFWDDSLGSVTWLTAGTGLTITNTTITAQGGGIDWEEVTETSQAAAVNTGYITNNAGLVTITIPDTAAVGDVIRVVGKGAGLFSIAQNASEIIHFGNLDTTTGVGGSITATHRRDSIELVCSVANTEWTVISSIGNFTVV